MIKLLLPLLVSLSLSAIDYKGCATTKQDALLDLSGQIRTTVHNEITTKVSSNTSKDSSQESIEAKVNSYSKNSTHLSLVKIKYTKTKDGFCASVKENDQVQNTKELFKTAMTFDKKDLANNTDEKIKKLSGWLEKIDELTYLVPEFYKKDADAINKEEAISKLSKKAKIFQDIYDETIAFADSLIFKSCESSREDAFEELNKQLFKDKTKKKDDEGIFGKTASFFTSIFSSSSDDSKMLDIFDKKIIYAKKDEKQCAIIKKSDLHNMAILLNDDTKRFDKNSLTSLVPMKKYKEILNYQEHLNVTKALLEVFPNKFSKADFKNITNIKQFLSDEIKVTHPQYVKFSVNGAKDIKIKVDDKLIEINKEQYLKKGEHTYTIIAKGKCPIMDTFSLDLLDKKEISKDLTNQSFPSVIFISDNSLKISIDGQSIESNKVATIDKCNAELRWIVKFDGQTKSGTLKLSPNEKEQIELNFLTSKELAVYNDSKTKNFTVQPAVKFAESLTPLTSPNFLFLVESEPEHGILTLHEKGSFSYKADEGYAGPDSFEYIIEANGDKSAPKIVNITVADSKVAVIPVAVKPKEEKKPEVKKEPTEEEKEQRYQKFKAYVDSQEQNTEKLKKLQSKYPDLFNRLVKEKMSGQ